MIYWKELYFDGCTTILDDLVDRLAPLQLTLCTEIEELLLNDNVTQTKLRQL